MIWRTPSTQRTDTLCPYTTLFRSAVRGRREVPALVAVDALRADQPRRARGPVQRADRPARARGARDGQCRPVRRRRQADLLARRSEEHTSELQSLMRISYAVFCLTKKNTTNYNSQYNNT